jgi:hypothetical protein
VSPAAPVPAAAVTIARRFRGPADSGNGGYVCGCLALRLDPPPRAARVRLRTPPPLDRPLEVVTGEDAVFLRDPLAAAASGVAVAEARALEPEAAEFAPDGVAAPSFDAATAASRGFLGFTVHPYPGCFVCGPDRAPGDGLRIFPGPLPGGAAVAAPWIPDASLARDGAAGTVAPEFVWAALDCPGGFAFALPPDRAMLLGELAVERRGEVRVGERCVVVGRELAVDGRKHFVRTALFGDDGECRGVGRATWVEVPAAAADAARAGRETA